jgi:hypothetical protein
METPVSQSEPIWSPSHSNLIRTALLTLALLIALARAEAATQYTFKGFDAPLDGVVSTTITGIDYKSGVIVGGYTDVHGNRHGWRGNSTKAEMIPLQVPAGINRHKWTVGSFHPMPPEPWLPPNPMKQGFLRTPTAFTPITIPGCTHVYPYAVNDAGEVVGGCGDTELAWHWKEGVVTVTDPWAIDLGCQGFGFEARGINNTGVIVGRCTDTGFIYDHGTFTLFNGTLGEPPQAYIYPSGINEKGPSLAKPATSSRPNSFPAVLASFSGRA